MFMLTLCTSVCFSLGVCGSLSLLLSVRGSLIFSLSLILSDSLFRFILYKSIIPTLQNTRVAPQRCLVCPTHLVPTVVRDVVLLRERYAWSVDGLPLQRRLLRVVPTRPVPPRHPMLLQGVVPAIEPFCVGQARC